MSLLSKPRRAFTLVSNEKLVFVESSSEGGQRLIGSLGLDDFLAGRGELPARAKSGNELLIIPDFWLGMKPLVVSSPKRSVIELLVRRKLRTENPDIPEVDSFFDYRPYRVDQERGVQSYFIQETHFARLHRRLEREGLRPSCVTTPGLLWERKLAAQIPDFGAKGIFLVNLVGAECFFYFFHQGRYLFSRDISISERLGLEERLEALAYEIDQSRFLFAQKAKAEIHQIYLISSGRHEAEARTLSEKLQRDIVDLSPVNEEQAPAPEELNAVVPFTVRELVSDEGQINLAHRLVRHELEWMPVQAAGLAAGACLLALLAGQAVFLRGWIPAEWGRLSPRQRVEQREALRQFNADLDQVLAAAARPSAADVVTRLAGALPAGVRVEQLSVAHEPKPTVSMSGLVRAERPEQLRQALEALAVGLRERFPGAEAPGATDIEFKPVEQEGRAGREYRIALRLGLP